MPLPIKELNPFVNYDPFLGADFVIESSLPDEISDYIISYDLDLYSNKIIMHVIVNKWNLGLLTKPTSLESITIKNHDREGKVILKTDLGGIINKQGLGIFGSYSDDDLLRGKIVFGFSSFYQESIFD